MGDVKGFLATHHFLLTTLALLLGMSVLASAQSKGTKPAARSPRAEGGEALFLRNCAACHGRDAGGGDSGPDLTRSELVVGDVAGDKIGAVMQNGRPMCGMPPFPFSQQQILELAAFLHAQKAKADLNPGGRRGVEAADLQSGNVEAGKRYFNGTGTCSSCHSTTGDLAGIARRYSPLELEERMLYPGKSRAYLYYTEEEAHPRVSPTVTVTVAPGETVTGALSYQDEFMIGLIDDSGWYHSWPVSRVKYVISAPAEAHVELLGKYTDDDIHNLMAYLQTLR